MSRTAVGILLLGLSLSGCGYTQSGSAFQLFRSTSRACTTCTRFMKVGPNVDRCVFHLEYRSNLQRAAMKKSLRRYIEQSKI